MTGRPEERVENVIARSHERVESLFERIQRRLSELQAEAGEGIEDEFEHDADDGEEEDEA